MKNMQLVRLLSGAVLILAAGGLFLQNTSAAQQQASAGEEVLQSYGDTKVIRIDPVEDMFSHKSHVVGLGMDCDTCHPDIFAQQRGAAAANGDYDMAAMEEGLYCGACHDGDTAFGVADEADCAGCHTGALEPPDVVVKTKPVKAVIFEHAGHVDMGLTCADCHNHIFEMEVGHAEKKPERYTMQALYDGKYCGACHNGEDAFASDTMCTSCHIGVQGYERMFSQAAEGSGKDH